MAEASRIRPATAEDCEAICDVVNAAWRHAYTPLLGQDKAERLIPTQAAVAQGIYYSQYTERDVFSVAEWDGRVVGMVISEAAVWSRRAYIWMLYVHPAYQNAGFGKDLVVHALNQFDDHRVMRLQVLKGNAAGISFYERQGFRTIASSWNLATREPIFVMQKPLRHPERQLPTGLPSLLFG
jgi:GNAT superfamily N-acetyltransferase